MQTIELKPCPFCRSDGDLRFFMKVGYGYPMVATIECMNDDCLVPKIEVPIKNGYSLEQVLTAVSGIIEKWNRRAPVMQGGKEGGPHEP